MLEDPELAYLVLTARHIAIYIGPERYAMFIDSLAATGHEADIEEWGDVFWDAMYSKPPDSAAPAPAPMMYGAEYGDDR